MAAGAFKEVPEIPTKGYGQGLVKGLAVTLRTMLKPAVTRPYPHTQPDLPARTRGVIALKQENCTVCYKCARECPDWCIYIDAHKETHPPAGGGKARSAKILDRFDIDFSLCMYCGICVEVCPFDALFWSPEFEYAEYDIRDMLHDKEKLEDWTYTVLPPPPIDDGAEAPVEVPTAAPAVPVAPTSVAPGGAPVAPVVVPEATPAPPATPPSTDDTGAAVAAGAAAGAPASAPPSAERHEVAMDQEAYQAKLKELLDSGVSARVAEGQARRAGMIAARKKAAGEG